MSDDGRRPTKDGGGSRDGIRLESPGWAPLMTIMRFHVPGIPHTVTNRHYVSCAYTQKVSKLCAMLMDLGHEVFHYGCEGSDPVCSEPVTVIEAAVRDRYYPEPFHDRQFRFDTSDALHQTFYRRCIDAIEARRAPRDFLLCAWGWGHKPIADGVGKPIMVVESGVGYPDVFAPYRVFESYAWMMNVYGRKGIDDGSWYDCVIPNFFDPDDFRFQAEKEDWFLYLGRLVKRKGVEVAVQVTGSLGAELVIAGQGSLRDEAEGIDLAAPHVTFAGFADPEKRRDLLARARAVFMPTTYIEPFGGVHIEAALSGTPVITTDWGVFGETVLHGITGYRCRTFDHFLWAARHVDGIDPHDCRKWAVDNFSMDRVKHMYDAYFHMLWDLWDRGWYEEHPERRELDWLRRRYPVGARTAE